MASKRKFVSIINDGVHRSLLVSLLLAIVHGQGEFPNVFNAARRKPVEADSLCGLGGIDTFCRFSGSSTSDLVPNCMRTTCNNTCPFGDATPGNEDLLTISGAPANGPSRPGSSNASTSFTSSSDRLEIFPSSTRGFGLDGFSLALWIRQDNLNNGTVFSKLTTSGAIIAAATVSQRVLTFAYRPQEGGLAVITIDRLTLQSLRWHHIAITVFQQEFSLFINGSFIKGALLQSQIQDEPSSILLGQLTFDGMPGFLGSLQDIYLANEALTVRDVQRLADEEPTYVHIAPECRCPSSHPMVDPDDEKMCTKTAIVSQDTVSRINSLSYPAGYLNEGGYSTFWVSDVARPNGSVVINLGNLPYEVFFVLMRFASPSPKAMILERSNDNGRTFSAYQYYADDCMFYFNRPDNEAITTPNGVNCITTGSSQLPTAFATSTFRPIDPNVRPATYDTSEELREFILATHLRLKFLDYFNNSNTFLEHLYYGIFEVSTSSRCACNGHAARCNFSTSSYTCNCTHNTMGIRCQQCLPMYNNKPWRPGIITEEYNCVICNCNNHAVSCHYNSTLDLFPESHTLGGGGVCDNCQHNTTGRYCETCEPLYYRPSDRLPSDQEACVPCGCDERGVVDNGDCTKDDSVSNAIAGQCSCKENVNGLKCNLCKPGFFNLSEANPQGCQTCGCSVAGSQETFQTCDAMSGQCVCKQNVMGLKCDQCHPGYTNLSQSSREGCSACECHPAGSANMLCDPVTAACTCREGVTGDLCDRCGIGFFGMPDSGCQPCQCSEGSLSAICDSLTGQCSCRNNTTGRTCSECADGYYNPSSGCVSCDCHMSGTINSSNTCNKETGQCDCKSNVIGRQCDSCTPGTTSLSLDGCSPCSCHLPNTNTNATELCDPTTSQCTCLEGSTGLLCDECEPGFFIQSERCEPCQCNLATSIDNICNATTGTCTCFHAGIGGATCESCATGYFQFPECIECFCDAAGSTDSTCDSATGRCLCKEYVVGDQCDTCLPGYSLLDASDPSGCAATPDEQSPPTLELIDATVVQIKWLPPERPNGLILYYNVLRDGEIIANTTSTVYIDGDLDPHTSYRYSIQAVNRVGSTTSISRLIGTSETPPDKVGTPDLVTINSSAIFANWSIPGEPNGVIIQYELLITGIDGLTEDPPMIVYSGLGSQLSATITGLMPYTSYDILLRACTSGGCNTGMSKRGRTIQAAPQFQPAPNVTTAASTSLLVAWDPPPTPNGIITQYQIHQRGSPFTGNGMLVRTVLANTSLNIRVDNLFPYTEYEFAVQSFTVAGGTSSKWTRGATSEDIPVNVQPPKLEALSSSSILINWTLPLMPNGPIIGYTVYQIYPFTFIVAESPNVGSYVLNNLRPFTNYSFILEACTSIGCRNSSSSLVTTLEAKPENQGFPNVVSVSHGSVALAWDAPLNPNGVLLDYSVQRQNAALTSNELAYERGVSFAGVTSARLSSEADLNLRSNFYTNITFWFRTYDTEGTIIFGQSTFRTDYFAVELQRGRPVFVFNSGSGEGRAEINSPVSFSDGTWHSVLIRKAGREAEIHVDNIFQGNGTSPESDEVIGELASLYFGGVPMETNLSGIVGSYFAGCIRNVLYQGSAVNFSRMDDDVDTGVSTAGCLVNTSNSIHFLGGGLLSVDSLLASPVPLRDLTLEVDFRTTDPDGVLFGAWSSLDYFSVELVNQSVYLRVSKNGSLEESRSAVTVCDGEWKTVTILMRFSSLRAIVTDQQGNVDQFSPTLEVDSLLLTSGALFGNDQEEGSSLGMALGRVVYNGEVVDIRNTWIKQNLVDLAWSPDGGNVTSCSNSLASVTVSSMEYTDITVNPFRTYLYRVGSRTSVGVAYGPWIKARTSEGAPDGVNIINVIESNSTSLKLTWAPPTYPNGIILRYTALAIPIRPTWGLQNQLTTTVNVSMATTEFLNGLGVILSGLEPATVYSLLLIASTSGGDGNSTAVEGATAEDIPEEVPVPNLTSSTSTSLTFQVFLPIFPNGQIIRYEILLDNILRAESSEMILTVFELSPFTNYSVTVQACTQIGCGKSDTVVFQTLPDRPQDQSPPELLVLDSRTIEAAWQPPSSPNGEIIEYRLIIASGPNQSNETAVFSGLAFRYVVRNLRPNTTYNFLVESVNIGGVAQSMVVAAHTFEDAPEGVPTPDLVDANSTAIHLSWTSPDRPNGIITNYSIILHTGNSTTSFGDLQFDFVVINLEPFTSYTFQLQACTSQGCGFSELVDYMTGEATPRGLQPLNITSITARSLVYEIIPVASPNGHVTYMVNITGPLGGVGSEDRVVYTSGEPAGGRIDDLSPYSNYSLTLEVENAAGSISLSVNVQTLQDLPIWLLAPEIELVDVTSILVNWSLPSYPNGIITHYIVNVLLEGAEVESIRVNASQQQLSVLLPNLQPFSFYNISVSAYNIIGMATSPSAGIRTGETAPDDFDRPFIVAVTEDTLCLAWDPPGSPNGILLSYQVNLNGSQLSEIDANESMYFVMNLSPFTEYSLTVTVCNVAACTESLPVLTTTLQDLADEVYPPNVTAVGSNDVVISWEEPGSPNGRILYYHIERRRPNEDIYFRLSSVDPTVFQFLDNTTLPFTLYQYRITVENGAGESPSPLVNFTTPEAPPSFLPLPQVSAVNHSTLFIIWIEPTQANGIISRYILKRFREIQVDLLVQLSADVFDYIDGNLSPYTTYSYTITACTNGGCTESGPSQGTTNQTLPSGVLEPSVSVLSSSSILITWTEPTQLNGVLIGYSLYRFETLIFEGQNTSFLDTGLSPYNSYRYRYTVRNGAGTADSLYSDLVRTFAAPPLMGPILTAEVLNSTSIYAEWTPPNGSDVRGPILSYELTVTSLTLPNDTEVINLPDLSTNYTISGLTPSTTYSIVVALDNGAGFGYSNNVILVTTEGIPAGVQLPAVTPLSSTSLQFDWSEPDYPNGIIILYIIYLNSMEVHNATQMGSVVVPDLTPFTNYTYQLEACTQFGCSRSQLDEIETPEGLPIDLATPTVIITGPTSAVITWLPPLEPNGRIIRYTLERRREVQCDDEVEDSSCTYVECPISHSQCGSECYRTAEQVCCDGVLYALIEDHICCGSSYLLSNSSEPQVCCDDELHIAQTGFQCCGERYLFVPSGSVCCVTDNGAPRIGGGTMCCGDIPFTESQGRTCCGGVVSTSHVTLTCCGGTMISTTTMVCCDGVAFPKMDDYGCCGDTYVEMSTTLCCTSSSGRTRVFSYENSDAKLASNETCCEDSVILSNSSCCNGQGYNNQSEVCADKSTSAISSPPCGTGITCPVSQAAIAFCNRCDFNTATEFCGISMPLSNTTGTTPSSLSCYETVALFSGFSFEYTNNDLRPFTEYSYRIIAANTVGNVTSGFATSTTDEAPPSFVNPPLLTVQSSRSIDINWLHPSMPNGDITMVTLFRNDNPIVMSTTLFSFSDTNLTAFTLYQYHLEVCTNGGCTASVSVNATTLADFPSGLSDPNVTTFGPTTLRVSWSEPAEANGIIQEYVLNETTSLGEVFRGISLSVDLQDLKPFTNYSFQLTACNQIGCVSSNEVVVQTPESPPAGVDNLIVVILNSRSTDISWTPPTSPNGIILGYILERNGLVVFNDSGLAFTDTGLTPNEQYTYIVIVYNSAGRSSGNTPAVVRMPPDTPEGLSPPQLDVLNSSSIRASWSPPNQTNGVITGYAIIINGTVINTSLVLEYIATGLSPYSVYSFRVEACTVGGCGRSRETIARTLPTLPSGLDPPSLMPLGPTAIQVSWENPSSPNGMIESYEVIRTSEASIIPVLAYFGASDVFTFVDAGLRPFTEYQYELRATNDIGFVSSNDGIRTPADFPTGFNNPTIEETTARSAVVAWQPPSQPNGEIIRYEVYYRLAVDPVTSGPGLPQLVPITDGELTVNITTLMPATTYEVMVVVINTVGPEGTVWIPFDTLEAPPQDLSPIIIVDVPDTGMSLVLAWVAPLIPNGAITEYILYVDGVSVFRGNRNTFTVMQLQPFTSYTLLLEACTSAGCTMGREQEAATAEVPPEGQEPPALLALSATSVQVTWQPPLSPNGDIQRYEILRRILPSVGSGNVVASPINIFNSTEVNRRVFNDTGLQSFRFYEYSVRVVNSAGEDESMFSSVRTEQAPPTGLTPPDLIPLSSDQILVQWSPPSEPNGIVTGYVVLRNGTSVHSSNGQSFTDTLLSPFTVYAYVIRVCTIAGCSDSEPAAVRTREALPTGLSDPLSVPASSESILISWSFPTSPNGDITHFLVEILPDDIEINYSNLGNLSLTVRGLTPFTDYTVNLRACNSVGCSETGTAEVQTLQDIPQFLQTPTVTALGPVSIEVRWQEPGLPNGIITRYELRRNGTVQFSGNTMSYIDSNGLTPDTVYSYDIQAFTIAGGSARSPARTTRTSVDTPAGVSPPSLTALSATSIRATWTMPAMPNGAITSYMLFINGTQIFRGMAFSHVVTGLLAFTEYEFYVSVCTTTCGSSLRATERTLEAPPEQLQIPLLETFPNITILIRWSPPILRNGRITGYEVEKRLNNVVTVEFQGNSLVYFDESPDLQPATAYQYRVRAINSAGSTFSPFANITTLETAPGEVGFSRAVEIGATFIRLLFDPPSSPNGLITQYSVYANGSNYGEIIPSSNTETQSFVLSNLTPATVYLIQIEACTRAGCAFGKEVTFTTLESAPEMLDPPLPFASNQREIFINWTAPAMPNGVVTKYMLWYQRSCPQPDQIQLNPQPCVTGIIKEAYSGGDLSFRHISSPDTPSDPLPYTNYQYLLQAENGAGGVNSTFSTSVTTSQAAPEVIGVIISRIVNETVHLDWSTAFRLNGVLQFYRLTRDGTGVLEGLDTSTIRIGDPLNTRLMYIVSITTSGGQATAPPIFVIIPSIDTDPTTPPTSPSPSITTGAPLTTQPPSTLQPGIIVVIVFAVAIGCAILLCCVIAGFVSCRPNKYKQSEDTDDSQTFAHARFFSEEEENHYIENDFQPMPYRKEWTQGDRRASNDIMAKEDLSENERPRRPVRHASYSPQEAEHNYYQQFNVRPRDSFTAADSKRSRDSYGTAESSRPRDSYGTAESIRPRDSYPSVSWQFDYQKELHGTQSTHYPKAQFIAEETYKDEEDFFEDDEPLVCTFADTRL